MIVGKYPCCGGEVWIGMPSNAPGFAPEDCPHCGAHVWHYFSRLEPKTWMEADFLAAHDVDEKTKTIVPKPVEA